MSKNSYQKRLDKNYGLIGSPVRDAFETLAMADGIKEQIRNLMSKHNKFIHPKNPLRIQLEETLSNAVKKLNHIIYKTHKILDDCPTAPGKNMAEEEIDDHKNPLVNSTFIGKIKSDFQRVMIPIYSQKDTKHIKKITMPLVSQANDILSLVDELVNPEGKWKIEINTTLNEMTSNLQAIEFNTNKRIEKNKDQFL
ncbi:MAG: hypothetical protein OXC03_04330 [Flavobacteriaceae bacterium]|nr:hypothetical protein [Flavobacteriaceae bacterium]